MKTIAITLLIATAFSLTAHATVPRPLVDMILLEHSAAGDKHLWDATVFTESGKQTTAKNGKFEYKLTPTVHDDGTVDVRVVLTERDGGDAHEIVNQRIKAKLGHTTEVRTDHFVFQTTTTVAGQQRTTLK